MTTREDVLQAIRRWHSVETEIKALNSKLRALRDERKKASDALLEIMRDNEVDAFELDNSKIRSSKRKVRSALTAKSLRTALTQYFQDDASVSSEDLASFVMGTLPVNEKSILTMTGTR